MRFFQKNRRSESIFEVIIAITVLSIGTSAITLLITTIMQANALSKQFIIANNLATEGLDAVSNIRESNWIAFPGYEKDCWNIRNWDLDTNTVNDATDCEDPKIGGLNNGSDTGAHYFIPEFTEYYGWKLTQFDNALSSDLSLSTQDDNYDLWRNPTTGLYTTSATSNEDTPFYRMVSIKYYYSDGTTVTAIAPTDTTTPANFMDVTSIVEWKDKIGTVHTVKKTMRLYNHVSS